MKHRSRGEGSVTQLPDGRWQARFTYYEQGKRKRKAVYGKTKAEALRKLRLAVAAWEQGAPVMDERQTVAHYLRWWLETQAQPTLRPSTYRRYRELVNLHALPALGRERLTRLTPQRLAALYADRLSACSAQAGRAAGLSARSVQFLHSVLHRAFRQAVQLQLLTRNPADAVQPPRPERREMQPLTQAQAQTLLRAAADDRLEALYVLAVTTGMRLGELLALRWQDVDLDSAQIQVRATLQRVDGEWRFMEPKSERSRRRITLAPLAVRALRRHRGRQAEERLALSPAWEDWGLVFCNEVGQPLDGRTVLKRFRRLLAAAGLPPIRFHDLRHTAATLLLGQGVHPKMVQDLLGHATIALTLDTYSHVTANLQEEVAARMEQLLR